MKVFEKIKELAPQFAQQCAIDYFEETSQSVFQRVFAGDGVVGCRPSLFSPAISIDLSIARGVRRWDEGTGGCCIM